jgi:hypothetical protein
MTFLVELESRILRIASLRDSLKVTFIFFSFFKLIVFQFHHSTFILLEIGLCYFFYLLSVEFFTNFEIDSSYFKCFLLSFFVKFSFLKRIFKKF